MPDETHKKAAPLNAPFRLSHGTMEVHDLAASRPFYEEFLGLECVRHGERSMLLRKGGYWGIVAVENRDNTRPMRIWNHWGLDVKSAEEVDRAHALAVEHKERYGLEKITKVTWRHNTYQFKFRDRDGNYWEFQHVADDRYDRHFAAGDAYPMETTAEETAPAE